MHQQKQNDRGVDVQRHIVSKTSIFKQNNEILSTTGCLRVDPVLVRTAGMAEKTETQKSIEGFLHPFNKLKEGV